MTSTFLGGELALWQIIAIFATYVFAALAKGVTGLGFSTTCLPILALVVGLKDALPLVIIPSISSNLVVMREAGRFGETIARFWPMLLATAVGLAFGLWALSQIDSTLAGGVLGGMLLLWCGFTLTSPSVRLPEVMSRKWDLLSGGLTGIVNGVTGSQVMPLVPYLMMRHLERNLFIQAVNCSFTMSSLIMAFGLNRLGLFSFEALVISILGTGVIFWGLQLGVRVQKSLAPAKFRLGVLLMLMAMGVSLVLQAI